MTNRIFAATVLVLSATIASCHGVRPRTGGRARSSRSSDRCRSRELEPCLRDPTNRVADDPRAADLGRRLFFDTRLSSNGTVACSTCHQPDRDFQDGTALGTGVGTTARRTMPIAGNGTVAVPVLGWPQGQSVGAGTRSARESGRARRHPRAVRARRRRRVRSSTSSLRAAAGSLGVLVCRSGRGSRRRFGVECAGSAQRDDVTRVFVNIGKAIAAYERRIEFGASRFDRYVAAVTTGQSGESILTRRRDRRLAAVHRQGELHAVPQRTAAHQQRIPQHGRATAAGAGDRPRAADRRDGGVTDEFNCRSRWSDARERCSELDFIVTGEHTLERAYKVPSLRNVAERAPVHGRRAVRDARRGARPLQPCARRADGPQRASAAAAESQSSCGSSKRSCER